MIESDHVVHFRSCLQLLPETSLGIFTFRLRSGPSIRTRMQFGLPANNAYTTGHLLNTRMEGRGRMADGHSCTSKLFWDVHGFLPPLTVWRPVEFLVGRPVPFVGTTCVACVASLREGRRLQSRQCRSALDRLARPRFFGCLWPPVSQASRPSLCPALAGDHADTRPDIPCHCLLTLLVALSAGNRTRSPSGRVRWVLATAEQVAGANQEG